MNYVTQYISFTAFNSNNFLLSERLGPADWHTANRTCVEKGMDLLKIDGDAMNNYVQTLIADE